jgi:uncharacterized repeat protein (TIGR03803 family)
MKLNRILSAALLGCAVASPAGAASFTTLYAFKGGADAAYDGANGTIVLTAPLAVQNNVLYGATPHGGGTCGCGAAFSLDLGSGTEQVLYGFPGGGSGGGDGLGSTPDSSLTYAAGKWWGSTLYGGANGNDYGTVFNIDTTSGTETLVSSFEGGRDGVFPGPLALDNGLLYGLAIVGGQKNLVGILFDVDPTTGQRTDLNTHLDFSFGPLVFFKGQAFEPGLGAKGSEIQQIDVASHKATTVYNFGPKTRLGGTLVVTATSIYGLVSSGSFGKGAIFQVDRSTGTETTLASLPKGSQLLNGLTLLGNTLYGTFIAGKSGNCSQNQCGSIFAYDLTAGTFNVVYNFTGDAGGNGPGTPLLAYKGALYGMTISGGDSVCSCGTVFKYQP